MSERFKLIGGVFCLIIKDNKVLMELRKNKFDAGLYSLVGGCMEDGETVKQAAVREIEEEVGLEVHEDDIEVISVLHRITPKPDSWQSIEFVLLVNKFSGNPNLLENNVCGDLKWFPLENLPQNISHYAKQAIDNYINKEMFSEINF